MVFEIKTTNMFDKFIECILHRNHIEASWKIIFLESQDWELYCKQRGKYIDYLDKYLNHLIDEEKFEKEWDDLDPEEDHPASCEPSKLLKKGLKLIEEEINENEDKKLFKKDTSFMREFLNSFDEDFIILMNLKEYKQSPPFSVPSTIAHEVIHIVEVCNGTKNKGKWIDEEGLKYAIECIDYLEDSNIKNHFKMWHDLV